MSPLRGWIIAPPKKKKETKETSAASPFWMVKVLEKAQAKSNGRTWMFLVALIIKSVVLSSGLEFARNQIRLSSIILGGSSWFHGRVNEGALAHRGSRSKTKLFFFHCAAFGVLRVTDRLRWDLYSPFSWLALLPSAAVGIVSGCKS